MNEISDRAKYSNNKQYNNNELELEKFLIASKLKVLKKR